MMRRLSRTAVLALIAMCLMAACGQKGPLYLPDEQQDEQQKDEGQQTSMPPHQRV